MIQIPREIDDILKKLKIVANIPAHTKFNVGDLSYSPSGSSLNCFFSKCYRWQKGEYGLRTYEFIDTLINDAISLSIKYPAWGDVVIKEIIKLHKAISNLEQTYTCEPKLKAGYSNILFRIAPETLNKSISEMLKEMN